MVMMMTMTAFPKCSESEFYSEWRRTEQEKADRLKALNRGKAQYAYSSDRQKLSIFINRPRQAVLLTLRWTARESKVAQPHLSTAATAELIIVPSTELVMKNDWLTVLLGSVESLPVCVSIALAKGHTASLTH